MNFVNNHLLIERMKFLVLLLPLVLTGRVSLGTESTTIPEDPDTHQVKAICDFTQGQTTNSGLIVGADVLLPDGHKSGYGVHITSGGQIGEVDKFDIINDRYKKAAVLNCESNAILSPGFINAHEHPTLSYKYLNEEEKPEPIYEHRDEWRKGLNKKPELSSIDKFEYQPLGDIEAKDKEKQESAREEQKKQTAGLIAVELRHLLGGATAIAGNGGVPGVIKNIRGKKANRRASKLSL